VEIADLFLLVGLRSHSAFESVLPPYPLAKLLLIVEIRTQEQGITDHPAMKREFSITGLLKPDFIDLLTDRIRPPHISFDSFCRKVEKASNIKFDAARDELGWVQEPQRPDKKQQYWAISCELTFQNALGMMQLSTTQSEPPQALILHLWSPAPKEPIFRRSRRAPVPDGRPIGGGLESEANSQQPLDSTMPPVINPVLDQSAKDANSRNSLGSAAPSAINPVLDQLEGDDDDIEVTSSTPPTASQSKRPETVQKSATDEKLWPQISISTNISDASPVDLDQPQHSDSESDATEERNSESTDQEQKDSNSASLTPVASTDYPHTDGQILLNMGMLLSALNPDDIRGGDRQPDETEEQYQIRLAEENELLAELENQRFVDPPHVFLSMLIIVLADFKLN
jgi:hypothetical protein